jgi:hypothetical protein
MSPYTGEIWLDRNLGATTMCDKSRNNGSFADNKAYIASQKTCFGDYYQWGRGHDGHEKIGSTTTASVANEISAARGNRFITTSSNKDWLKAGVDDDGGTRISLWGKTDGTSICPIGFRVPTEAEFSAEKHGLSKVFKGSKVFKSFLKLPTAGYRNNNSGAFKSVGGYGVLWTKSIDSRNSRGFFFYNIADIASYSRSYGIPVRCIREE